MAVCADAHSSVLNRKAFAFVALSRNRGSSAMMTAPPTGSLSLEANWRAQAAVLGALPDARSVPPTGARPTSRCERPRSTCTSSSSGCGSREAYAQEIASLRRPARQNGIRRSASAIRSSPTLRLPYVGGDIFLDGSIGSGTAALGSRTATATAAAT